MSINNALGGLKTLTNQVQGGVNTLTRIGADLGLGGVGGISSTWMDGLRDASYRGVPFVMVEGHSVLEI